METKTWEELTLNQKAKITKARLLDPESSNTVFANAHGLTVKDVKRMQGIIKFDEATAMGALMGRILESDNELLELSTELNAKFAKQSVKKRTIQNKDVETMDKIANTAMKRAALVAAANSKGEEDSINITLTF